MSFGLPGLGMFAESYIIFSVGNIKQWQQWSFPSCYNKLWPVQECGANNYLGFLDYGADGYVQLIGIIVSIWKHQFDDLFYDLLLIYLFLIY